MIGVRKGYLLFLNLLVYVVEHFVDGLQEEAELDEVERRADGEWQQRGQDPSGQKVDAQAELLDAQHKPVDICEGGGC